MEFSNEVVECRLQLITTEPEDHYGVYLSGLNWKSGRAFCLTSNIGIPHGPTRSELVGQLLRDYFTATIVRVFSSAAACATATGQVHYEAMALARSSVDRLICTGVLPKGMTDRLQCTMVGRPMRLMKPTAAAHAAATPLALSSRFHTVPMSDGQSSTWAYDQLDRHQMGTVEEVSGELFHDWSEDEAARKIQQILEVAKYEGMSADLTVASATKIVITPGPGPYDNFNLEKACVQHCDHLRKNGETGLSCQFIHAPPYRPNPIPQAVT